MSARIMVVEDEEALTTLLRYNLDAEGYDVETVARGDDADTRLKERVPDLVVLDWMLPGLSGIELCRRLRARPETKAVADHHADRARRGERAGAGAGDRRRRLHRKAVLGAGTAGAGEGPVAAREPRAARHRADLWRHRTRSRESAASRARAARSISARPSIACWNFSSSIPAASSAASNCSTASGAATSISTSAPSTSISAACANCSIRGREQDPIRTVRGAGYALDDRFAKVEP